MSSCPICERPQFDLGRSLTSCSNGHVADRDVATPYMGEVRRVQKKHDDMVSALREIQEENRQLKKSVEQSLVVPHEILNDLIEAVEAVEDGSYWLNKARTDDDHEDAGEQLCEAEVLMETMTDRAARYLARKDVAGPRAYVRSLRLADLDARKGR